jgi:hypothetical protein
MNAAVAAPINENQTEEVIVVPQEAVELSQQLVAQNSHSNEKAPSCIKSGVAYSPRMTKAQRKELFMKGQITDCEGNIWNIKVIPGSDKSKEMTIHSWRYAGKEAKQIFKIETYKKAGRDGKYASKASFNFAKSSSKLLKKGVWDYMIVDGIYNDLIKDNARVWKNAGVTVVGLRGSFAWLFGAIYAGILKPVTLTGVNIVKAAYHLTAGTVILVGGIAGTAGGLIATVASPVIVPVVEVMTKPLLAVGSILTTGSVVPGLVYVWNGAAWASTQLSHVPDSETVVGGVQFVRLENPKQPVKPNVEVTLEDLNAVIESNVKRTAQNSKYTELESQRMELEKQIAELQKKVDGLTNQEYELRRNLEADASVVAVSNLQYRLYGANIIVNQAVLDIENNDQELRNLVDASAEKLGISLSENELEAAVKDIKQTMNSIKPKS